MKSLLILFFLIQLNMLSFAQTDVLKPYRWESRVLLVFADNAKNPIYQKQMLLFEQDKAGIIDRDLVIFHLFTGTGVSPNQDQLQEASVRDLRQHYNTDSKGYTIILIGKDSGEKLRSQQLLSLNELYNTIDVMPMRRAEMRRKQKGY